MGGIMCQTMVVDFRAVQPPQWCSLWPLPGWCPAWSAWRRAAYRAPPWPQPCPNRPARVLLLAVKHHCSVRWHEAPAPHLKTRKGGQHGLIRSGLSSCCHASAGEFPWSDHAHTTPAVPQIHGDMPVPLRLAGGRVVLLGAINSEVIAALIIPHPRLSSVGWGHDIEHPGRTDRIPNGRCTRASSIEKSPSNPAPRLRV